MTRRRISPRLREDAAVACAQIGTGYWRDLYDLSKSVRWLAAEAFTAAGDRMFVLPNEWAERWAEAESLLRSGWTP